MKRLIICIIVFNSLFLPVYACGPMYPFGDDIRFSILNPAIFGYADFGGFNYSANIYFDDNCTNANEESGRKMNVLLWKAYCKNKIDTASIYQAIYEDDDNEFFNNLMIRYFFQSKDRKP